ncbi:MAG: hypothetical protein ACQEQL_04485 [Pseudomonadota bacterium]
MSLQKENGALTSAASNVLTQTNRYNHTTAKRTLKRPFEGVWVEPAALPEAIKQCLKWRVCLTESEVEFLSYLLSFTDIQKRLRVIVKHKGWILTVLGKCRQYAGGVQ